MLNILITLQRLLELLAGMIGHLMFKLTQAMREIVKLRICELRFVHHAVGWIK